MLPDEAPSFAAKDEAHDVVHAEGDPRQRDDQIGEARVHVGPEDGNGVGNEEEHSGQRQRPLERAFPLDPAVLCHGRSLSARTRR